MMRRRRVPWSIRLMSTTLLISPFLLHRDEVSGVRLVAKAGVWNEDQLQWPTRKTTKTIKHKLTYNLNYQVTWKAYEDQLLSRHLLQECVQLLNCVLLLESDRLGVSNYDQLLEASKARAYRSRSHLHRRASCWRRIRRWLLQNYCKLNPKPLNVNLTLLCLSLSGLRV